MEQVRLDRPAGGSATTSRSAFRLGGAALVLSLALAALSPPAAAQTAPDDTCRSTGPVFTARGSLNGIAKRLARHEPVRILAIGSSSTQGIGASLPDRAYPAQLQEDLTALWHDPVTVVNAGIGGEKADRTEERLEAMLRSAAYDLVIWQVGTNDAVSGAPEEAFRQRLERGIAAARNSRTDMMLLDPQFFPAIRNPARYERFVETVNAVAAERNVSVFSRYAMMKAWGSRSAEALGAMLAADKFHMGDKGYDCLASRVARAIGAMAATPAAMRDDRIQVSAGGR